MQKKLLFEYAMLIVFVFLFGGIVAALESANFFYDDMLVTNDEIERFSAISMGNFLVVDDKDISLQASTNSEDIVCSNVDLNLFGFIKIKSVEVKVVNTNLIVCGNTVGVYIENNGVTVVGFGGVKTNNSIIYPFENSGIKVGDIILSINDEKISSSKDIDNILSSSVYQGQELVIKYLSGEKECEEKLYPVYDEVDAVYKLGLWIRENASGIGTLTFITEKNNKFGALGHGICENGQKTPMTASGGTLHQCNILGINKGKKGVAGEIKAMFRADIEEEGVVIKNNECGVFGQVKDNSVLKNGVKMEVGGKLTAKPGKAYIYCQLDEDNINKYEIEIIKTNYQSKNSQKSLVIRITDKRLLEKTGGIIQGMSGSPIVQNDKIVGAVTHVFVNDPTKGFGIYLDWMLNQ